MEALDIYEMNIDQDLRERANTAEVLGLVYLNTVGKKEASEYIKDALEIKRGIFDETHPEIVKTLGYLNSLDEASADNGKNVDV